MLKKYSKANYQDILKSLAIITMTIDHIGLYFYPEYLSLRIIGRISMPIFCLFAGYNFHKKTKIIILILGLLLAYYTKYIVLIKFDLLFNILVSIFLGQCYLYIISKFKLLNNSYSYYLQSIIWALLTYSTSRYIEYGTLVISIMILGYAMQQDVKNKNLYISSSLALGFIYNSMNITSFVNHADKYIWYFLALSILTYFIMIARNFDSKINLNLKFLSRYSLYLYFIQIIIFQAIIYYLYIRT